MKVNQLIDAIKEYGDFEIEFCIGSMKDNTSYGMSVINVNDLCIDDIGHSEKILKLGYRDILEGELEIKY